MSDYGMMVSVGIVGYLIISGYGLYEMRKYSTACSQAGVTAFGNSVWKVTLACLACGLFTTIVLVMAAIGMVFEFFVKMCRK